MIRIPVRNTSDAEVLVGLEPEGDTLPLMPGETCTIEAITEIQDLARLDFQIEYSNGLISVCLMCTKTAFVDGRKVR